MANVQTVENADVYNDWMKPFSIDNYQRQRPNASQQPRQRQQWEAQFDESLNLNPPCYIMPPQNLTNIALIKKRTDK